MRTKLSTCTRKARFGSKEEALGAIHDSGLRCTRIDATGALISI
jgi:hypothetical protein